MFVERISRIYYYTIVPALLILLACSSYADSIRTKQGDILRGTVSRADSATVFLQTDTGTVAIAREGIDSVTFTTADLFKLTDGTIKVGKLYAKKSGQLQIVSANGLEQIEHARVEHVVYNTGTPLTVSELPPTGELYLPGEGQSVSSGNSFRHLVVFATVGSFGAAAPPEDLPVLTEGIRTAAGVGYATSQTWMFTLTYEHMSTPNTHYWSTDVELVYDYIFATARYALPLTFENRLLAFGSVDLGYLNGTETQSQRGYTVTGTGSGIAGRLKTGFDFYFPRSNLSATIAGGILFANVNNYDYSGELTHKYLRDVGGTQVELSVYYHIPLGY